MPKQTTRKRRPRTRASPSDFAAAFLITALVAVIVLAIIAAVRGWREGQPGPEVATESGTATVYETSSSGAIQAVAGPGADGALSLAVPSRRGKRLAWTGTRHGESGLWLADEGGMKPTLLAAGNPSPAVEPAWSEDDSRIAWLERIRPGVGTLKVAEVPSGSPAMDWSVECDEAAGVVWMPGTNTLLVADPATDKLLAVPLQSGKPAVVAEGIQCAEGGPGLRVGRAGLDVYALDDRSCHILGTTERNALTAWIEPSPDGQVLAIVEAPATNGRIVNLAVAPAGYLTRPRYQRGTPGWVENAPRAGFPTWSTDSARLLYYFARDRGLDEPIGILRDDGEADAVVLERSHGVVARLIHWPGDGGRARAAWVDRTHIAYLEGEPPGRLWLVSADTGNARLLWDHHRSEAGDGR